MHTFTKKIAVFGVLLASANMSYSMECAYPIARRTTDNSFQVLLDRATNQWSPEISGQPYVLNHDNSAVIVEIGHQTFTVVKTTTGKPIHMMPVTCLRDPRHLGFLKKGTLAYLVPGRGDWTLIVNTKNGHSFMIPGGFFSFSPEDDFVVVRHAIEGKHHQSIFDATNGEYIASIPSHEVQVSPYSAIMLVDTTSHPENEDALLDPILIEMATGQKIGQLEGTNARFSPDGQFVLLQQYSEKDNWRSERRTAVYSTTTGKLVRTFPGHFNYFVDQDFDDSDLVRLNEPFGAFRISDGAPVR